MCTGHQGMHDSDDRSCDIFWMMPAGRLGFCIHVSDACAIAFVSCSTVHYLSCVFVHAPPRLHIAFFGQFCKQLLFSAITIHVRVYICSSIAAERSMHDRALLLLYVMFVAMVDFLSCHSQCFFFHEFQQEW